MVFLLSMILSRVWKTVTNNLNQKLYLALPPLKQVALKWFPGIKPFLVKFSVDLNVKRVLDASLHMLLSSTLSGRSEPPSLKNIFDFNDLKIGLGLAF